MDISLSENIEKLIMTTRLPESQPTVIFSSCCMWMMMWCLLVLACTQTSCLHVLLDIFDSGFPQYSMSKSRETQNWNNEIMPLKWDICCSVRWCELHRSVCYCACVPQLSLLPYLSSRWWRIMCIRVHFLWVKDSAAGSLLDEKAKCRVWSAIPSIRSSNRSWPKWCTLFVRWKYLESPIGSSQLKSFFTDSLLICSEAEKLHYKEI